MSKVLNYRFHSKAIVKKIQFPSMHLISLKYHNVYFLVITSALVMTFFVILNM